MIRQAGAPQSSHPWNDACTCTDWVILLRLTAGVCRSCTSSAPQGEPESLVRVYPTSFLAQISVLFRRTCWHMLQDQWQFMLLLAGVNQTRRVS